MKQAFNDAGIDVSDDFSYNIFLSKGLVKNYDRNARNNIFNSKQQTYSVLGYTTRSYCSDSYITRYVLITSDDVAEVMKHYEKYINDDERLFIRSTHGLSHVDYNPGKLDDTINYSKVMQNIAMYNCDFDLLKPSSKQGWFSNNYEENMKTMSQIVNMYNPDKKEELKLLKSEYKSIRIAQPKNRMLNSAAGEHIKVHKRPPTASASTLAPGEGRRNKR